MFWHKKEKFDLSVFVIGLIGLGIIISIAFVLILFTQSDRTDSDNSNFVVKETSQETFLDDKVSSEKVKEEYFKQMVDLQKEIESYGRVEDIFDKIDSVLFSIHVPEEFLQKHFQLIVKIKELKKQQDGGNSVEIKRGVLNLINGMLF